METINERIKIVRTLQDPKMSQDAFGAKIGITGAAVSRLESGGRNITDQVIVAVCREFRVREQWLRDGVEPMFQKVMQDDDLTEIFAEIKVSDDELIKSIMRTYWRLTETEKAAIRKMIDGLLEDIKKGPG